MKIWLQSGSALATDGASPYGQLYEDSMERRMNTVARPGVTVETFGIDGTPHGKDRYHAAFHMVTTLMIKSALRAKESGFDAVAIINTFDHGYYEMREVIDLPLAFISESAMYLACQLAPSFGFVTHNQAMLLHISELAKRYGVAERMAAGIHLGMSYVDFPKMHDDPMIFIETFTTAARAVISRGAATILVAGNPMNMFLIDHDVREVDGVPILDCCAAVVKTVEMLVDLDRLGIRRGQTGLFTAPPPNERVKLQYLFD